jgi:hypothetical protein
MNLESGIRSSPDPEAPRRDVRRPDGWARGGVEGHNGAVMIRGSVTEPPMSVSVPPSHPTISQGLGQLRAAIGQAADLAGQIERGQAQMPLRDHFEDLARGLETSPFTLTLLGLDAASRGAALGWLCGTEIHVLTLEVPGAAGLVEVQLAERGYVLLKSGRRQEFDRLEPFLEAVRAADLVRQGDADTWLEPMHLEMRAPAACKGCGS